MYKKLLATAVLAATPCAAAEMQTVSVSDDGSGFVLSESEQPFVPWGFNYDHDQQGRLVEDYWDGEWARVEEDFREMKELGANVVRIHLQFDVPTAAGSRDGR